MRLKGKDVIEYLLIFIIVGMSLFIVQRFFSRGEEGFEVYDKGDVIIKGVEGEEKLFKKIVERGEKWLLFLELSNCGGCIIKGMDEVENLKKIGKSVAVIVIHSWFEDFQAWSKNYAGIDCYYLEKRDFLKNFFAQYLPSLVLFKQGKLKKMRYIVQ